LGGTVRSVMLHEQTTMAAAAQRRRRSITPSLVPQLQSVPRRASER
jgi:hypothetical protein